MKITLTALSVPRCLSVFWQVGEGSTLEADVNGFDERQQSWNYNKAHVHGGQKVEFMEKDTQQLDSIRDVTTSPSARITAAMLELPG